MNHGNYHLKIQRNPPKTGIILFADTLFIWNVKATSIKQAAVSVKAYQSKWQRLCCRLGFGSKRGPQRRRRPQAGQWRSLGRWRKWMRPDWEPLALSQSPVESAGSACMTLLPGYILFWGLENTREYTYISKSPSLKCTAQCWMCAVGLTCEGQSSPFILRVGGVFRLRWWPEAAVTNLIDSKSQFCWSDQLINRIVLQAVYNLLRVSVMLLLWKRAWVTSCLTWMGPT